MAEYDKKNEPIVISKFLLDIFFNPKSIKYRKLDHPADLISLYIFYYYTAKWQNTNSVQATTEYTAKGLKWSSDRVRQRKKELIKLDLIEDKISKNPQTNQIEGHYILVKFIWGHESTKSHTQENPEYGESPSMENPEGNALDYNSRNALGYNSKRFTKVNLTDSNESEQGLLTPSKNETLQKLESRKIPPNSLQYNLIEFWNNLPNVPTKHIRPNTKVRLTVAKYFTQLASGCFDNDKKFKPGFLNDHKLSSSILAKKWTREEIKAGLKRLNDIFIEGYWPRNKDNLPRDLATLIYNPGKQNSWFLMITGQPPEVLNDAINFNPENHKATKQYPDIINPIIKQFQTKQVLTHDITAKSMDEILSIIEYHKKMNFSNNMANYRWGNLKQFIDDFCNFINSKNWLDSGIINISAEGKIFQAFVDDCEDELYNRTKLRPSKTNEIKENFIARR